jgi:hypothetical protein
MPNTGRFYLLEVTGKPEPGTDPPVCMIDYVRAECLGCHRVFCARCAPALVTIPRGGVVLQCPHCTNRQAISSARFEDFMDRFAKGCIPKRPDLAANDA